MRVPLISALWVALLLLAGPLRAEQAQTFDQYEIHYNAFNSTFLPPEVAVAYNLQRSKYGGVINVAVLDDSEGKRPTSAQVSGSLKNLIGQRQELSFREIREGNAIYYISAFRFTHDEQLQFSLDVKPDRNKPAYSISFKQHFYAD
ncbi:DUF4426 domain-containing protein [Motiliproteus sediminis]|uniref:DUF4426 domain-containing protein n=1 Tax=Motiliproteus sediminis TaxID=1468178 RepID=UPI001AEFF817|nr:DUF4426 domain-containing protein [Motiliproteus sediminis]